MISLGFPDASEQTVKQLLFYPEYFKQYKQGRKVMAVYSNFTSRISSV